MGQKGDVVEGVRLLWRPQFYNEVATEGKHWAAIRTIDELKQMFAFVDQCQYPEEFFERYGHSLRFTPEDKSTPLNFIPLATHLDLTGKIFRVLRFWSTLIVDGKIRLQYDKQKIGQVAEAMGGRTEKEGKGKWVFRLVKCWVRFSQTSLPRLQDLNVLRLRRKKIEEIIKGQQTGGNVGRQPYAALFLKNGMVVPLGGVGKSGGSKLICG